MFPAGILQTPYFNASFPEALNFAGAGVIMGHELTHGFDSEGRDYNGYGLLTDWWQNKTRENFNEKVACVINQYSKFEVLPGVYVNGNLTQGENVADMGGVKNAHAALQSILGGNFTQPSIVEGLTNEQLFFVGYSQGWCAVQTDEYLKVQVETDPHSPSQFRAIGPLINLPQFAKAFNCANNTGKEGGSR